ncbi:MAG: D-arabinono-1,4-lactone oxidase [Actinomycetota bacterium]
MPQWSNWSGRHTANPTTLHFARNEDALAALVSTISEAQSIRVAASGHSHMPLIPNDDCIIDMTGLTGVIGTDSAAGTARVWAGTTIAALGRPLHEAGLALHNQGDIDRQQIGGAIATGTHGTGKTLSNLSAAVTGARVVLASGDIVECSEVDNPELFQALRLNIGGVGVVTQLEIQCVDAFRLRERGWEAPIDELRPQLETLAEEHRHFEFFWYPGIDRAAAKAIDTTDDAPEYPLAEEGARCGWNYEVLPNHRPHLHTEMEFSVPLEQGPACLDAIVHLLRTEFTDVRWPVEYRTLAADDVWLSTAGSGPVATISVHQGIDHDEEPFYRSCEEIFRSFDGRPHWGKVNWFSHDDFAATYDRWDDWWQVRDEHDPNRAFLGPWLGSVAPG